MPIIQEFKQFAIKGNVVDLAIGVIIGGAFGKIVESLVSDLIMPIISMILGGRFDFSGLFLVLGEIPAGTPATLDALKKAQVPVFAYGNFITILLNFIILAFIIFMMVKQINRLRPPPPPPSTPEDTLLLREIRDSLKPKSE